MSIVTRAAVVPCLLLAGFGLFLACDQPIVPPDRASVGATNAAVEVSRSPTDAPGCLEGCLGACSEVAPQEACIAACAHACERC